MTLLVIDTSGPVCGTAVMDENKVYSEFTAQNRNTPSALIRIRRQSAGMASGHLSGHSTIAMPSPPRYSSMPSSYSSSALSSLYQSK